MHKIIFVIALCVVVFIFSFITGEYEIKDHLKVILNKEAKGESGEKIEQHNINETLEKPLLKYKKNVVSEKVSKENLSKAVNEDDMVLAELVDLDYLKFVGITIDDAQELETLDLSKYPTFKNFEILKYFRNLKNLNVSGLDFTSNDYSYITSGTLEKLDVSNTKVDDTIIERLTEQKKLRMVRFTGLELNEELVFNLREIMPSTSVYFQEQDEDE